MAAFIKIILFMLAIACGYLSIMLLPYALKAASLFPQALEGDLRFWRWYFAGSFFALMAGALTGLGSFFSKGAARVLMTAAPFAAPFLWALFVILHFATLSTPR